VGVKQLGAMRLKQKRKKKLDDETNKQDYG